MSEPTHRRTGAGAASRVASGWILLPVILYVLSVGPAVRFFGSTVMLSGMKPGNRVGKVWMPILAMDETPVRPALRAYMRLWGVTYLDAVDVPLID